jgi:hypothetical protein
MAGRDCSSGPANLKACVMREVVTNRRTHTSTGQMFRVIMTAVIAIILGLPVLTQGALQNQRLNENAALDLLVRTLKRDRVYEKRIALDCVSYSTEEMTHAYFEFVLRELHNAKCGGDKETNPVIDRYRVYRTSGKIKYWEAAEDKWQPYRRASRRSA